MKTLLAKIDAALNNGDEIVDVLTGSTCDIVKRRLTLVKEISEEIKMSIQDENTKDSILDNIAILILYSLEEHSRDSRDVNECRKNILGEPV